MTGVQDQLLQVLTDKNWMNKFPLYNSLLEYLNCKSSINKNPEVSIVVISWRLHRDTLKNLQMLQKQKEKTNFEIIFVDNGAGDQVFNALESYIDFHIRLNKNTGAYLARNIGAAFANAPVLLFLEDDGIPDSELVDAHLSLLRNFDAISIRGVYLCKTDNPLNERQNVYYWGQKHFPAFVSLEGNASYRADLFYKVGGWDDNIIYGHGGLELAVRLLDLEPDKRKQIYSPLPVIYHDLVDNEDQFLKKRQQHVIAYEYLKNKHPDVEVHREEWQDLFLKEEALLPIGDEQTKLELEHLQESIFNRNMKKIEYMNNLFIPTYDNQAIEQRLLPLLYGKKCSIFGAGSLGEHVWSTVVNYGVIPDCFYDNNVNKWGTEFCGIEVKSPATFKSGDFIIVASIYSYEIVIQLESQGFIKNHDFIIMK